LTVVLHYAVVLYTRLAPYREYYLHLSYANFYVKARKIYKFLWGWQWGLPKASTGRVWLRPSGYAGPKSAFESPHCLSKNFKCREQGKVVFRSLYLHARNFMC